MESIRAEATFDICVLVDTLHDVSQEKASKKLIYTQIHRTVLKKATST